MPKVVDHEQRKREVATAVWSLAARRGISGVSARNVAAEGGWSLGALRHYFSSQDELITFAVEAMLLTVTARVRAELSGGRPGLARCQRALECLLPLDEERLGQVRAWLALAMDGDETTSPGLERLRHDSWLGERRLCRAVVSELAGLAAPAAQTPLSRVRERQAAALQTTIDGLSLQGALTPRRMSAVEQRTQLRRQLQQIAASR